MRILIDINHPAHVHFFRHPIEILRSAGHELLVTSRDKEVALPLLDGFAIEHRTLSAHRQAGAAGLLLELLTRDVRLLGVVRSFRPQVLAAIGGTFIAHVGKLASVPSIGFYDTENATLQNAITYPFLTRIHVPACYTGRLPAKRHQRYAGYHELSYLRPEYFSPDRSVAIRNGLDPDGATFLLRLVSWKANHDIGEKGWNPQLLQETVEYLRPRGRVLISAEGTIPEQFRALLYRGDPRELHHVMAFCTAVIGESATMASEAAVLGVPSVYAATTGRGYTNEIEARYGLVQNVFKLEWPALRAGMESILSQTAAHWQAARERLLRDTIDVAGYVADAIVAGATPAPCPQTRS